MSPRNEPRKDDDEERNDTIDRLYITALRPSSIRAIANDPGDDSLVPLIDKERVLRTLIGSKRSWPWHDPSVESRQIDAVHHRTDDDVAALTPGEDALRAFIAPTDQTQWLNMFHALGCVAYEGTPSIAASAPSGAKRHYAPPKSSPRRLTTTAASFGGGSRMIAYLPPYEYSSTQMYNQAKQGIPAFVNDVVSDRGGTIKSILQSSKSFVHVLTTHPLKNTFRGYIQIRPYLSFGDIGLPYHHAMRIFSLNLPRDAAWCAHKPPRCGPCQQLTGDTIVATTTRRRRCAKCPFWPDDSFEFCFDTNRNFGLYLKRDPCIHNGSIVPIFRVYVTAPNGGVDEDTIHREAVYVSSFSLKNLNADFDGDTVTVMIARGLESTCELRDCLREPLLFGATPRFTFSQSMVHRVFRRLCFGERDETHSLNVSTQSPVRVKRYLLQRLNLWQNKNAVRRAELVFGPWYRYYRNAFGRHRGQHYEDDGSARMADVATISAADGCDRGGDASWWTEPIWPDAVLDRVHQMTLADGHETFLDWMTRRLAVCATTTSEDTMPMLTDNPLCLENWLIVHSGAKSCPRELWGLYERMQKQTGCWNRPPQFDLVQECSLERATLYSNYLDDFVSVSKNVPKGSYFSSGLKWVMQKCSVSENNLRMNDVLLLENMTYYLRDIELDFV